MFFQIYNLSFEFLRHTYMNVTKSEKEGNSLTEYYSILRVIYMKLIQGFKVGDKYMYFVNGKIRIIKDEKYEEYEIKDFRKNPKRMVKMI
nr:DUF2357 domain-containing protein [Crassaminicella indica]